ncbi:E3 SUMO-protein ligase ZBED1 isoform X2 [Latimeria chalumnae]|nr:PREDICTED: zinc finger BED domain-containing protein 1-like isoform X2 [Latimeria chalumnae]|eukprot:XP_005987872.1 PREDICTED: zinc finger BED domain-containing protein 1-like isoform X2 [Latimeria chalumnae]
MANLEQIGTSQFMEICIKREEGAEDQQLCEETLDKQILHTPVQPYPPTAEEDLSSVFQGYNMASNLVPTPKRKRDKSTGQDRVTSFPVDRRKSKVWNYYTKLGDTFVECTVCNRQLSFHNSTTTMREHLVRKHGIRDNSIPQVKEDQALESEYSGQETLTKKPRQMVPDSNLYNPTSCVDKRADRISDLVLEMIFRDLHPLSVVEEKGFRLLVGSLEPSLKLPSVTQLSSMLWHKYNVVKQHLEHYLHTAQSIVLCMDIWTAHINQMYLTVTAHFIDYDWNLTRCILDTRLLPEAKLKDNLGEILCCTLMEFGLSSKSTFCVLHDNIFNMLATFQCLEDLYGWKSTCCSAHMLHLCVKAGLEVEQVQQALIVARDIVGYFQHDSQAAASLNSKLEAVSKAKIRLTMDVPSRWITTIEMCEQLLDLKWAITSVLEEQATGRPMFQNLADHQWKLLQDTVVVLRTIRIATAFLSEEQNVSVSSLMPCLYGVMSAIGQQMTEPSGILKTFITKIRSEIKRRWHMSDDEKMVESPAIIASFLDPRFKEMRFLTSDIRSELHKKVKNMLSRPSASPSPTSSHSSLALTEISGTESDGRRNQLSVQNDKLKSGQPLNIYDILLGEDPTESMPEIHQQLENYIVEPLCKRSTNPLDWWRNNEHRFPAVAKLARQYLAVPAMAITAERAFASKENTLEQRRSALSSEHLGQILFLNQNFDCIEVIKSNQQ